jgi:hypothetical protein
MLSLQGDSSVRNESKAKFAVFLFTSILVLAGWGFMVASPLYQYIFVVWPVRLLSVLSAVYLVIDP